LPYQLNQTNFYRIKDYYKVNYAIDSTKFNDRIVPLCFDSVYSISENSRIYYSKNFRSAINYEKCNSQIQRALSYFEYQRRISIDSFLVSNDTIFLADDYYSGYFLKIPINISIGDSCVQPEYSITYIEKNYNEILPDLFDSVKVFKVKYNIHRKEEFLIKLSKNNGIISNSIWDDIGIGGQHKYNRETFEIIGISNSKGNSGLVPKEFNNDNFFQQKVGDLKYWTMFLSGLYEDKYAYFKDSITSILNNENLLKISYKRFESREGNISSSDWSETFIKDQLFQLTKNPYLNYYKLGLPVKKNLPEYNCDILFKTGNFVNSTGDLFDKDEWGYPLLLSDYIYNSDSCNFDGMVSEKEIYYLFPKVGLAFFQGFGDFGQDLTTLEAYTLNGKLYGNIPGVFNSVSEDLYNNSFISPNPASDYIEVNVGANGYLPLKEYVESEEIRIFDIFGNEIHPPRLASQSTPQVGNLKLDVSALPAGVYFVRIGNEKPMKFVKL
jgi:hypothetical protein